MIPIPTEWIKIMNHYRRLERFQQVHYMEKLNSSQRSYLNQILAQPSPAKASKSSGTSSSSASDQASANANKFLLFNTNKPQSNLILDFTPAAQAATLPTNIATIPKTKTTAPSRDQVKVTQVADSNQKLHTSFNVSKLAQQFNLPNKPEIEVIQPILKSAIRSHDPTVIKEFDEQNVFNKKSYLQKKRQSKLKRLSLQAALVGGILIPLGLVGYSVGNQNVVKQAFANQNSTSAPLSALDQDKAYRDWIGKVVKSKTMSLDQRADPDQDGLTNFEEYNLRTIPDVFSTTNNKRGDGENLLSSIDPLTGNYINYNDAIVTAKYDSVVLRQTINDRLALIALDNFKKKKTTGSAPLPAVLGEIIPNDTEVKTLPDSETINPEVEGVLTIPKFSDQQVGQGVKLQWLKILTSSSIETALQNGVAHFPRTAFPGETGNVYISGRSSDLAKTDNKYATVFGNLNKLDPGDQIHLTVSMKDGSQQRYIYKIRKINVVTASDTKQFDSLKEAKDLTLATTWPKLTSEQRLVVRATFDSVVKL